MNAPTMLLSLVSETQHPSAEISTFDSSDKSVNHKHAEDIVMHILSNTNITLNDLILPSLSELTTKIITDINVAETRKFHAYDGDMRLNLALLNYCKKKFRKTKHKKNIQLFSSIVNHLRSNTMFHKWYDLYKLDTFITNHKLKFSSNVNKFYGTVFEAFISILFSHVSLSGGHKQKYINRFMFNIIEKHFNIEEYLKYYKHSYMDTLHLPYRCFHDYKAEFCALVAKCQIMFDLKNLHYDEGKIHLKFNPLLPDSKNDISYKITATAKNKKLCQNKLCYKLLKEFAESKYNSSQYNSSN